MVCCWGQQVLVEARPGAGGLIVRVSPPVPVPPEFVALKERLNVPELAGVPEISPVVILTAIPTGSPVALKLVGLLVAVI